MAIIRLFWGGCTWGKGVFSEIEDFALGISPACPAPQLLCDEVEKAFQKKEPEKLFYLALAALKSPWEMDGELVRADLFFRDAINLISNEKELGVLLSLVAHHARDILEYLLFSYESELVVITLFSQRILERVVASTDSPKAHFLLGRWVLFGFGGRPRHRLRDLEIARREFTCAKEMYRALLIDGEKNEKAEALYYLSEIGKLLKELSPEEYFETLMQAYEYLKTDTRILYALSICFKDGYGTQISKNKADLFLREAVNHDLNFQNIKAQFCYATSLERRDNARILKLNEMGFWDAKSLDRPDLLEHNLVAFGSIFDARQKLRLCLDSLIKEEWCEEFKMAQDLVLFREDAKGCLYLYDIYSRLGLDDSFLKIGIACLVMAARSYVYPISFDAACELFRLLNDREEEALPFLKEGCIRSFQDPNEDIKAFEDADRVFNEMGENHAEYIRGLIREAEEKKCEVSRSKLLLILEEREGRALGDMKTVIQCWIESLFWRGIKAEFPEAMKFIADQISKRESPKKWVKAWSLYSHAILLSEPGEFTLLCENAKASLGEKIRGDVEALSLIVQAFSHAEEILDLAEFYFFCSELEQLEPGCVSCDTKSIQDKIYRKEKGAIENFLKDPSSHHRKALALHSRVYQLLQWREDERRLENFLKDSKNHLERKSKRKSV